MPRRLDHWFSTNQKVSNVLDHAGSEVHKAAMSRKRAESAKARGESAVPRLGSVDSRSYHASKNGADIRCVLHDGKGEHSVC